MSIRTEVTRVSKRNEIMKQYETKVRQIIAKGGQDTMNTAKQSIQAHGSSGKTYKLSNPNRTHTASAPYNPPNSDTGYLVANINLVFPAEDTGFAAEVESRAEYSVHLEFGTSKMRERPFLQPALEENRPKIRSMFARLKARG